MHISSSTDLPAARVRDSLAPCAIAEPVFRIPLDRYHIGIPGLPSKITARPENRPVPGHFLDLITGLSLLPRAQIGLSLHLTRLKAHRLVNPDRNGLCPVARVVTDAQGTIVPLKGDGRIRRFTIAAPDGGSEWWATHDLNMTGLMRVRGAGYAWTIEHYHRGIKQFCGVERAQGRAARAQRNHIGLCLRAFLRLERYCSHAGIRWFEAKIAIIRPAVRAYLANPLYTLPATA